MPPTQIAVQACHSSIEAARYFDARCEHPYLVLVGISNEEKLHRCLEKIRSQGIVCYPFYESDLDGELTAFATEPISADQKHIFKRFQLLKTSDFQDQCAPVGGAA